MVFFSRLHCHEKGESVGDADPTSWSHFARPRSGQVQGCQGGRRQGAHSGSHQRRRSFLIRSVESIVRLSNVFVIDICLGNNAYGQCGRPIIEHEDYFNNRVVHKVKGPWSDEAESEERLEDIYCGQDHRLEFRNLINNLPNYVLWYFAVLCDQLLESCTLAGGELMGRPDLGTTIKRGRRPELLVKILF